MFETQDWKIAAIYHLARKRKFDTKTCVELLVDRAKLGRRNAELLVPHWMRCKHFREAT